jgi:hypothetical protein
VKRLAAAIGFTLFFVMLFAPVLFSGSFMTSGDGLLQGLPTFLGRTPLWEPNMMLGYPLFADPNQAFWYPVQRIMRMIPNAFNAYVTLPYVLAAVGMAGFTRRATGSTAGSIVAGLTFSLGGFMISHQGHVNLIHPAAWTPFILWSVEELRRRATMMVSALGAIAFALCAVSGPQQSLVYILLVAFAYAIIFRPQSLQKRFWLYTGLMFALGAGLSAIALVPTAELTLQSTRADQTLADYTVFSTGRFEFVIRTLFPYFFDNLGAFAEASNYAGILPLLLGALALVRADDRRQVWFWFSVALWGAWMSLGDGLLGARIAFHIPIYSLFRIPGRHALEFTMAIAVLASFGVATLERASIRIRDFATAILPIIVVFAGTLVAIAMYGNDVRASVAGAATGNTAGAPAVPLLPWENSALAIPCGVLLFSVVVLLLWRRIPNRNVAAFIGTAAVACDLLSFAGSSYWRYSTVTATITTPAPRVAELRDQLMRGGYRLWTPQVSQAIRPNLSVLWGVPSVGGYVSLEDRRVADLLLMNAWGYGAPSMASLDIVGTRYIFLAPPSNDWVQESAEYASESLEGFVGSDTLTSNKTLAFALPTPRAATAIDLVSALSVAPSIPQGSRVADIIVSDEANHSFIIPVIAGRDTSESAFERADVRPIVRHREARIFSGNSLAHLYVARFAVPTHRPIRKVELRWRYADPAIGAMAVEHIAVVDGTQHRAYALHPIDRYFADGHWRPYENFGSDVILENTRAMPGAWAVSTVRNMDDRAQKITVQNGFDTRAQAVTADEPGYRGTATTPSVVTAATSPDERVFTATCTQRCMLVVNQLFYPGWQASVDGVDAPILRVDYLFQGVDLSPGRHAIRIWFAPLSLFIGATISALALLATLTLVILRRGAV